MKVTERPHIIWVSTSLQTQGGVASAVRNLLEGPLTESYKITHVSSHVDGGIVLKSWAFLVSIVCFLVRFLMERPVLVHLHAASRGSFFRKATFLGISKLLGAPCLWHLHGAEFDRFYERGAPIVRFLIRTCLKRSRGVIVLSRSWRDWVHQLNLPVDIFVSPNSIGRLDSVCSERVGCPPGHRRVVFLGRLGKRKGVYDLVRAWALVADVVENATLFIAGDGDQESVHELVASLKMEDRVTIMGWQSESAARALLSSADLLVLPSYAEGQPMVILEALSLGVAVVASRVGGVEETLDMGRAGMLVDPGDIEGLAIAIGSILADDAMRQRIARAGQSRASELYSLGAASRRLQSIYESCRDR